MELMEDGTTIEQQMFAMATEKKVPLYGVLELLPLCNLNCDMCYVRMSREEMEEVGRLRTMEEWTKTAEDMMRAGTLFVLLTGGEPLLYPHFRELYQKLRELGMIITINTNGTLIDEAWADFFAENKPRRINITLYGASNETYERLCHYPGGFDKAVNGIRLLRERNIDVKVNGSLAKANVDDRMKIIELGESLDAPVRIDTYMYPSVRERNHAYNNQARLDPEMAAKARVEVLRQIWRRSYYMVGCRGCDCVQRILSHRRLGQPVRPDRKGCEKISEALFVFGSGLHEYSWFCAGSE